MISHNNIIVDICDELTKVQQTEIKKGINELKEGKRTLFKDVLKEIS